jgi:hypothetical protein
MPLDYTITIPDSFSRPWVSHPHGQFQLTSSPTTFNTYVDASAVSEWIHKFSNAFPRFERISNNSLYPILEKELQDITPLLAEGQNITTSLTHFSVVSSMINDLVKPRLAQLQTAYIAGQKKVFEHPKEKREDARLSEKWGKLGLPASILENHADCARFLIESGLAFSIVGYRESCNNPNEHDLKLDHDGHPMLKMRGRFVRWEAITREIHYDANAEKIKSRAYPGNLVQTWNYFHPDGLVPVDRFDCEQIFPVYELSVDEYQRTRQHALKFYETNPEKDPGIAKDCIVQFITVDHRVVPASPLFDNAQRNYPVHVGMRLITADRKVYSFGYQLPPEEANFVFSDYFSTFLTTAEAKIGVLDYEEFRPDNKLVTSIPLTAQRGQNIIDLINTLKGKQLRFQYMRQNCSQLMLEVMQKAGYDVDIRTTGKEVLYDALPSLSQIPVIGAVDRVVRKIWNGMPSLMTKPIEFSVDLLLFVPKKIGMIATNFLAWKMGAAKKTTPLQDGVEDEEFYDKKKLQSFSTLIRSWFDLFREETNAVYHSKYFIDWQKKQRSTFTDVYSGCPKLSIVPPVA